MKRLVNLENYKSVLPYSSEIFGVYQPLFGWRSQRLTGRIERGFTDRRSRLINAIERQFIPRYQVYYSDEDCQLDLTELRRRRSRLLAIIDLSLLDPSPQRLLTNVQPTRNLRNHTMRGTTLTTNLKHQANGALTQLVRVLLRH